MLGDGLYRIIGLDEVTDPASPSAPPALVSDPGDLALLTYTSGTAAQPRRTPPSGSP